MQRTALFILIVAIAGLFGLAFASGTSANRDIEIELLTDTKPDALFVIDEIFDLRNREGFLIRTHQSHFWQAGDFLNTGSLQVETFFDDVQTVEPFVFWRSSVKHGIYDENEELVGGYLAADMNINVNTSELDLGEHMLTISVQTPHDETFSQNWRFVIRERAIPRLDTPIEIAPIAEYLYQHPLPTPEFVKRAEVKSKLLDQFSPLGNREGLCVTLNDEPFVPSELAGNPFRSAIWDEITVTVDNVPLNDNQLGVPDSDVPGVLFLCIDTDFLAAGTHLAEISMTRQGATYSFAWGFVIE